MLIDRQLIAGISKGDEKCIYKLYHHCYQDLYRVCRRYATNEDEIGSLLNSAFLKIVRKIKSYNADIPFEAWIRRIMINTAIDHYRKQKKYKATFFYPDEEQMSIYHKKVVDYNVADQSFDAEQLQQFINHLPPVTKTVFNLFAVDGYSHKEIGAMLKISVGTSKWHLSTARRKLQDLIEQSLNDQLIGENMKKISG